MCSHSKTKESNLNQEIVSNPKSIQVNPTQSVPNKPIQSRIDVKVIHDDTSTTKLDTENDNTKRQAPKTIDDTGIFNKISSIWTKRNENTASDATHKQRNDKNQDDSIVKSFKKLFKD